MVGCYYSIVVGVFVMYHLLAVVVVAIYDSILLLSCSGRQPPERKSSVSTELAHNKLTVRGGRIFIPYKA